MIHEINQSIKKKDQENKCRTGGRSRVKESLEGIESGENACLNPVRGMFKPDSCRRGLPIFVSPTTLKKKRINEFIY